MRQSSRNRGGRGKGLLGGQKRPENLPCVDFTGSRRRNQRLDVLVSRNRDQASAAIGGKVGSSHDEP